MTYYMQRDGIVKPVEQLIQTVCGPKQAAKTPLFGKAIGSAACAVPRRAKPGMTPWSVARHDGYSRMRSSFCKHRVTRTTAGISSSGKLVFQSVTPTSPT